MVKNLLPNVGDAGDMASTPGSGRSPGVGHDNPLQVFLPREFHGQRSLVGYSPWGLKESDRAEHTRMHAHTFPLKLLSFFKATQVVLFSFCRYTANPLVHLHQ